MSSRLPNLLISNELISQEQYLIFKSRQKDSGNSVITELTKLGVISEEQIAQFISNYYSLELVDLEKHTVPEQVLKLLSKDFIQKYQVLPLSRSGKTCASRWSIRV
jgi:type IV pilus assembly protein PilB